MVNRRPPARRSAVGASREEDVQRGSAAGDDLSRPIAIEVAQRVDAAGDE